jgi:diguanylate cyclase (GGDEF)-like protein/PAS domain S-box-containing protein
VGLNALCWVAETVKDKFLNFLRSLKLKVEFLFKVLKRKIQPLISFQNLGFNCSVLGSTIAVTALVLILRALSGLQGAELGVMDQFFRWRAPEAIDERIVIVGIDENDVRQNDGWSMSDQRLVDVLSRIQSFKPRTIGLDLYRDLSVPPGTEKLASFLKANSNIIGIEQLSDQTGSFVAPSRTLTQAKRVGFNNIILDVDQRVRRSFLYWKTEKGEFIRESFSLKLAKSYLAEAKIFGKPSSANSMDLKLGQGVFRQLQRDDGHYVGADAGAYQVLVNFRGGTTSFRRVTLQELMSGEVPESLLRDRIVMIGTTATSSQDFAATPYTHQWMGSAPLLSGVELQAQFTSQILGAAIDGRPLLKVWSELLEILWIAFWSGFGVYVCERLRSPRRSLLAVLAVLATVLVLGYCAFVLSWVIPVVAPMLGVATAFALVTSYVAQSEVALKRSKDFLAQLIDTIPDPVFVQDRNHRWIVINQAYARFVGAEVSELIGKTVYDVFPQAEAAAFHRADEQVLVQQQEREFEESLTDLFGKTYSIATKRSLYRDASGNLLLVGVIRDITTRKSLEESLRRTTEELSQSNQELRQSQTRLHYLANHDSLTGLPNRQLFHEKLGQTIAWAEASSRFVALLFIDLDGFKQVNDSLGHGVGDQLLQSVAKRLIASLRASDTVARLGGDEFTVILPAVPGLHEVEMVAQKVIETLALPYSFEGQVVRVSASVGVGFYPNPCKTSDLLLLGADSAMYRAKAAGKNQYAIATAQDSTQNSTEQPPNSEG